MLTVRFNVLPDNTSKATSKSIKYILNGQLEKPEQNLKQSIIFLLFSCAYWALDAQSSLLANLLRAVESFVKVKSGNIVETFMENIPAHKFALKKLQSYELYAINQFALQAIFSMFSFSFASLMNLLTLFRFIASFLLQRVA